MVRTRERRDSVWKKMFMTTRVSDKRDKVVLEGNVRVLKNWTRVDFLSDHVLECDATTCHYLKCVKIAFFLLILITLVIVLV